MSASQTIISDYQGSMVLHRKNTSRELYCAKIAGSPPLYVRQHDGVLHVDTHFMVPGAFPYHEILDAHMTLRSEAWRTLTAKQLTNERFCLGALYTVRVTAQFLGRPHLTVRMMNSTSHIDTPKGKVYCSQPTASRLQFNLHNCSETNEVISLTDQPHSTEASKREPGRMGFFFIYAYTENMNIPHSSHRTTLIATLTGALLVIIAGVAWWALQSTPMPSSQQHRSSEVAEPATATPPPEPSFDKNRYSRTDPTSQWVVINKQHPVTPLTYAPTDLITGIDGYPYSSRIDDDLRNLVSSAASQGVRLHLTSAYRPYSGQQTLYANYSATYGQAAADTISARAGHSEHQTGLTVDIGGASQPSCNFNPCFSDTIEGKWLATNSNSFGFIVRYTPGNEAVTGYSPEAWHLRYVGHDLAKELALRRIDTLEEFFAIPGGTTYKDQ